MSLQIWGNLLDRINYWVNSEINTRKKSNGNNVAWVVLSDHEKCSQIIIFEYDSNKNSMIGDICNVVNNLKDLTISKFDQYFISHTFFFEPFIEKYKDCLNWEHISKYQFLPESFIEKYKEYIDWYY